METKRSHFWIGNFESEELFFDFIKEDHSRYELDDYDDIPNSKFTESQKEVWIDYDFLEFGFEKPQASLLDQFKEYSYSDGWGTELEMKKTSLSLAPNTIVFTDEDQISTPTSVNDPKFELIYLGVIEYKI